MDDPIVVAAIISLIGVISAAVIAGIFHYLKNNSHPMKITNGLLTALQSNSRAVVDLTTVLRENQTEVRQAHNEVKQGIAILLDRTEK